MISVRLVSLLYIVQEVAIGNGLPYMWYMLCDMRVARVAFMCKEAWLDAGRTDVLLIP